MDALIPEPPSPPGENNTIHFLSGPAIMQRLPPETLWRIFLATGSPKQVFTQLPRVCKAFNAIIQSRSIPIIGNITLIAKEDEEGSNALLQCPEPARLYTSFHPVVLHTIKATPGTRGYLPTPLSGKMPNIVQEETSLVHIAGERLLRVHMNAITENPQALVEYLRELLRRGASGTGSKRPVRIIFGTVQVGRRGAIPPEIVGSFLQAVKPLSISIWLWDSELIRNLPDGTVTLKLPNMRADGHIQPGDLALLAGLSPSLKRLELFRPMPRQPWGLESMAFTSLSALTELRELIVKTGRIIGSYEVLTTGVLTLKKLNVLELPWNLDSRLCSRLIYGLPNLKRLQYVHVSSPDFFQALPTYHENAYEIMNSPPGAVKSVVARNALVNLVSLGLNYMEPDSGDLSIMVEGLIRCLPKLKELTIRINIRPNEATYDFFSIPREYLERCLRRLEFRTSLHSVSIELGLRMWASRKSYADDLVAGFTTSRMKVRFHSPVGRIGYDGGPPA
ncbi:hypothetical protein HDU97_010300 [Phlyctochytrium planicorne]|nr:hypothetical protein HDU97_010300 [Phlyctochytrium planicorne]